MQLIVYIMNYILALISLNRAFSLSMSVFCWGQPITNPSSTLGLGIWS